MLYLVFTYLVEDTANILFVGNKQQLLNFLDSHNFNYIFKFSPDRFYLEVWENGVYFIEDIIDKDLTKIKEFINRID